MQDTILTPSATQDPTSSASEPRAQGATGAGDEGQQQGSGTSSIQRLKQNLRDAIGAAEHWKQAYASQEEDIESLKQSIDELKRQRDPKSPEDYSENELLTHAFSDDVDQRSALKAAWAAMQKRLAGLEDKFADKLERTITDHFTRANQQQTFAAELQRLSTLYGQDNLTPGADLHSKASQHYQFLQKQDVDGLLKVMAIERAARDLGLEPKRPDLEGTRPSAETTMESGSDLATEIQSQQEAARELLDKGDVQGAIRARIAAQFGAG